MFSRMHIILGEEPASFLNSFQFGNFVSLQVLSRKMSEYWKNPTALLNNITTMIFKTPFSFLILVLELYCLRVGQKPWKPDILMNNSGWISDE